MHEPDGRRPGRVLIKQQRGIGIAPNGIGLRRWAEPDRGEAQCGWSDAMQRRGTPSPPKVYRISSN